MKTNLVILIIALVAIVMVGGIYLYTQEPTTLEEGNEIGNGNEEPVACQADAMQCPDGSYVSRVAPSCEFAECPISDCLEEGEIGQPTAALGKDCCVGLKPVNQTNVYDATCNLTADAQSAHRLDYVCVACGNNECGLGENKCNCPADCTE